MQLKEEILVHTVNFVKMKTIVHGRSSLTVETNHQKHSKIKIERLLYLFIGLATYKIFQSSIFHPRGIHHNQRWRSARNAGKLKSAQCRIQPGNFAREGKNGGRDAAFGTSEGETTAGTNQQIGE